LLIYPIHQNFLVQLKNWFQKLSYREYSPIYYPPIIADSSFTKIFSLKNFVSYSIPIAEIQIVVSSLGKSCCENQVLLNIITEEKLFIEWPITLHGSKTLLTTV